MTLCLGVPVSERFNENNNLALEGLKGCERTSSFPDLAQIGPCLDAALFHN